MFLKSKLHKWFDPRSIRFRLTAWFTLILALTLIFFSWLLYKTFIETHKQEFDNTLFNYAIDVVDAIDISRVGKVSFDPASDIDKEKILPFSLGSALVQIRDKTGRVLFQSGKFGDLVFPFKDEYHVLTKGQEASYTTLLNVSDKLPVWYADTYRLITFPIDRVIPPNFVVQIAAPRTILEAQQREFQNYFYFWIPLVLLVAMGGGLFLAGRALTPVKDIIHQSNLIGAQELSKRLQVPKVKDEISELVVTLNGMLGRIEQSFLSQERFIADASHQLLTPLSIIRGELDILKKNENPEEMKKFILSASQEIDHLAKIVSDMLLLERVDAGVQRVDFVPLDIDDMLIEAISKLSSYAQSKNIMVRFDINQDEDELMNEKLSTQILGERDLLSSMFKNLIENGIKYSPEGSSVIVKAEWGSDSLRVRVKDFGPGIDEQNAPHIFERFYRAPRTSNKATGFGLGLSIARKIAEVHGGTLEFKTEAGNGTEFIFELKRNQS